MFLVVPAFGLYRRGPYRLVDLDSLPDGTTPDHCEVLYHRRSEINPNGNDCLHVKVDGLSQVFDVSKNWVYSGGCDYTFNKIKFRMYKQLTIKLSSGGVYAYLSDTLGFMSGSCEIYDAWTDLGHCTMSWSGLSSYVSFTNCNYDHEFSHFEQRITIVGDRSVGFHLQVHTERSIDRYPTPEEAEASERSITDSYDHDGTEFSKYCSVYDYKIWKVPADYRDSIEARARALAASLIDNRGNTLYNINWGQISADIGDNIIPNHINALTLLPDILSAPSSIKGLYNCFETFLTGSRRKRMKALADTFLSVKYGTRLTYADLQSFTNSILGSRAPKSKTSATMDISVLVAYSRFSGVARCSCNYEPLAFYQFYDRLDQMNLTIHASDLWDIIPYSFVVDWFLPIGDYLEKYDKERALERYHVSNIWHTVSLVESNPSRYDWDGSSLITSSKIFIREGVPYLTPMSPGSFTPTFQKHVAEGSALVIQRVS